MFIEENPKGNQTPTEAGATTPPTPQGTEGEATPQKTEPKPDNSPGTGETPSEEIDYKKKFGESTKENQELIKDFGDKETKLLDRQTELENELAVANENPSDEGMTEAEKDLKKNQQKTDREIALLKEAAAWNEDFAKTIKQFPQLVSKEEAFKEFCYKYPKSVDAATLAKSFLYEDKPEPAEPKVETPRPGLEPPSGGGSEIPETGLTLADITDLRENHPRKYLDMIRTGKIKTIPEK